MKDPCVCLGMSVFMIGSVWLLFKCLQLVVQIIFASFGVLG